VLTPVSVALLLAAAASSPGAAPAGGQARRSGSSSLRSFDQLERVARLRMPRGVRRDAVQQLGFALEDPNCIGDDRERTDVFLPLIGVRPKKK